MYRTAAYVYSVYRRVDLGGKREKKKKNGTLVAGIYLAIKPALSKWCA